MPDRQDESNSPPVKRQQISNKKRKNESKNERKRQTNNNKLRTHFLKNNAIQHFRPRTIDERETRGRQRRREEKKKHARAYK